MIESILTNIPELFTYWTGFLISWSLFTIGGILYIIHKIKKPGRSARRSDLATLSITIFCTILMFCSMFVFTSQVALIFDTLVMIDISYSLFMLYITYTTLTTLPVILFLKSKHIMVPPDSSTIVTH